MLIHKSAFNNWLSTLYPDNDYKITKLAGDASFRTYYRLCIQNSTKIIMHAPPNLINLDPFIEITHKLQMNNFKVPKIHAVDYENGFMLLEDLGDNLLLESITSENADSLYKKSMDLLANMQVQTSADESLAVFNKSCMFDELNLFNEWFVDRFLEIKLDESSKNIISDTFNWLTNEICKQPLVFTHRDFHSRNIMLVPNYQFKDNFELGLIDYQDAVIGPFTYDLVSLIKDCYIEWPLATTNDWIKYFYAKIKESHGYNEQEFIKAVDLCGLQRHLKVLGIFSRLSIRDNKDGYLKDLPLTFRYVMNCLKNYNELGYFHDFMQSKIQPMFLSRLP
jgi:aminoglycoside/choline kinase family phosphotransferase